MSAILIHHTKYVIRNIPSSIIFQAQCKIHHTQSTNIKFTITNTKYTILNIKYILPKIPNTSSCICLHFGCKISRLKNGLVKNQKYELVAVDDLTILSQSEGCNSLRRGKSLKKIQKANRNSCQSHSGSDTLLLLLNTPWKTSL